MKKKKIAAPQTGGEEPIERENKLSQRSVVEGGRNLRREKKREKLPVRGAGGGNESRERGLAFVQG